MTEVVALLLDPVGESEAVRNPKRGKAASRLSIFDDLSAIRSPNPLGGTKHAAETNKKNSILPAVEASRKTPETMQTMHPADWGRTSRRGDERLTVGCGLNRDNQISCRPRLEDIT